MSISCIATKRVSPGLASIGDVSPLVLPLAENLPWQYTKVRGSSPVTPVILH